MASFSNMRRASTRQKGFLNSAAVAALQCLLVVTFAGADAWACEAVSKDQTTESNSAQSTIRHDCAAPSAIFQKAFVAVGKNAAGGYAGAKHAASKVVVAPNDPFLLVSGGAGDADISAAPPPAPEAGDVDPGASLDLQSVRARAFLGLGNISGARSEAQAVLAQRPNDVGALGVLAMADETQNLWRQAASRWSEVYSLNGDPAAAARRDALVGAHPSSITAMAFFEGASGSDQQHGVRALGAWRPLDGPEWSAQIETRQAEADQAIRLNGAVGPISLTRQRGELAVADTFAFGRLEAAVSASQSGIGGHASFGRARQWGSFEVIVGANEPYWLYSTGIVNEATSDFVGGSVNVVRGGFGARVASRVSNYGVADDNSIARSTRVSVGLDAAVSRGRNPFRLSYVLDGEYFNSIEQRTRTDGSRYAPMPFTDREVHSFGAYKGFGDTAKTFVTLGAGYRADRYGANGPFASVTAEGAVAPKVRIGARLEYSQPSIRGLSGESYSFGELYVRRVF